jgi:glucose-6-phosphate isomerase
MNLPAFTFPPDALARIVERDGSLYSSDPGLAKNAAAFMGWTELAHQAHRELPLIDELVSRVKSEGLTDVVLLGMGGSSLAALVLAAIVPGDGTRLHVLDTTSPITVAATLSIVDPATTLFLVSSKSGGTIEPNALYAVFRDHVDKALGGEDAGGRFVAITDPGSSLERLAADAGMRACLLTPADVGGRYSALTLFGLVPAALMGIDIRRLISRAVEVEDRIREGMADLPLAHLMAGGHADGRDKLIIVAHPDLRVFGLWAEQLVAESLGKQGRGVIPVVETGVPNRSTARPDEIFVLLDQAGTRTFDPDEDSPHLRLEMTDPHELGAWFVEWEYSVALAGHALGVDPFDQPNVAEAKAATSAVLDHSLEPLQATTVDRGTALILAGGLSARAAADMTLDDALAAALDSLSSGDYLALLAYLPYDETLLAPLRHAVAHVADALDVPFCLESGPRYLHSTGQLHKGGPNSGVFIMVTTRDSADLSIPGWPFGLATLHRAQAEGDLVTLAAHGRRVLRVDLHDASTDAMERLSAAFARATSTRPIA